MGYTGYFQVFHKTMRLVRKLIPVLVIAFGIFLFVYGERDDSPGAQGLGLIIATFAIVALVRRTKRTPTIQKTDSHDEPV